MTLRDAFGNIKFRKGTWVILFDDDDETELYSETLDELETAWNEFADENDISRDCIEFVYEGFDVYHGGWLGNSYSDEVDNDKEYIKYIIKRLLENKKHYELDGCSVFALRAALKYIAKANVDEDFWIDGIDVRYDDIYDD